MVYYHNKHHILLQHYIILQHMMKLVSNWQKYFHYIIYTTSLKIEVCKLFLACVYELRTKFLNGKKNQWMVWMIHQMYKITKAEYKHAIVGDGGLSNSYGGDASCWLVGQHPMPFGVHKHLPVMQKMIRNLVNRMRNPCALIAGLVVALQRSFVLHLALGFHFQSQVIQHVLNQVRACEFPAQFGSRMERTTAVPWNI